MLQVTWEWLGMAPALDLANTVAVADGVEHDLVAAQTDYAGWARVEAEFLSGGSPAALLRHRDALLELRAAIRQTLAAVTAGGRPPSAAVEALNVVSRSSPEWTELDARSMRVRKATSGDVGSALLARYARSAMDLIARDGASLRRCPAPSCGMFYVSSRASQTWCSVQCGTRARVARHYRARRAS